MKEDEEEGSAQRTMDRLTDSFVEDCHEKQSCNHVEKRSQKKIL